MFYTKVEKRKKRERRIDQADNYHIFGLGSSILSLEDSTHRIVQQGVSQMQLDRIDNGTDNL